jgi:hypothetical protein
LNQPNDASHQQYNAPMKTATLPPVRVAPEFRQALEEVLEPGESLSQFVEHAVRSTVEKRKHQAEFLRRGMAAIQDAQRDGNTIAAQTLVGRLEAKLSAARQTSARRG